MSNPITPILATNLKTWWLHLSLTEKLLLLALSLLASVAIPISMAATSQPNRTRVGAQNMYPSTRHNQIPQLPSQTFQCRVNEVCSFTVKAVDPDITDELFMEIDFLPANLKLTHCETQSTLTGNLSLNCTIEGTPSLPGRYKLLGYVRDVVGTQSTGLISLNIK